MRAQEMIDKLPVIAIFDIGKTNKKLFLLDEQYRIVFERTAKFTEITDEDGDPCDSIESIRHSATETLGELLNEGNYDIKAVNFATYGASFVYIDAYGKVLTPLYNYLKAYPPELQAKFYHDYGGEEKLSLETASPVMGSLNAGLQLYRLKHEQPEVFKNLRYALHLPQYMSYVISNFACSDLTSVGCHTHLWDFNKNEYHEWVHAERLMGVLPHLYPADKVVSADFMGHPLKVGTGLHDSSASLIPYLSTFKEPFALLSTGTWCITLNPFNEHPLTYGELKQECNCYLSYTGNAVKASRLFAGNEHEVQTKRLAAHFLTPELYYRHVIFNKDFYKEILQKSRIEDPEIDIPTLLHKFGRRSLKEYNTYEEAYHQLIFDLAKAVAVSSNLVMENTPVKKLFADGGFGNNPLFMQMLADALPGYELYASSVPQATALGAAMAIHQHWNEGPLPPDLITTKKYEPLQGMQAK
jgi:sugar (pentulose or hexulose) kinase